MGMMERLGRKARQWAGALLLAGAAGTAIGTSGCATSPAEKEVVTTVRGETPEVEVVEGEEYIDNRSSITDEDIDRVMENVYRAEGRATYELVEEQNVEEQRVVAVDEEEVYQEVLSIYETDEGDGEIELGWHGSMSPVVDMEDGTGFLTAHHVTGLGEVIEYEGENYRLVEKEMFYHDEGEKVELAYEAGNENKDVALLWGEDELDVFDKFADSDAMEYGDVVFHAGFPLNLGKTYTEGIVANMSEGAYMITTMPASPGDSGSPVYTLTEDGELRIAGIVNFTKRRGQLMNGIARADEIMDVFERKDIDVEEVLVMDDDAVPGR